ncbi:LuxR C-terminal-related transcriptional regulator [Salmonella enterica]
MMRNFIENKNHSISRKRESLSSENLNHKEYRVLYLYIRGMPVSEIAHVLGMSYKRISGIKNYAMVKIGVKSDAGLIYYWDIIRRWL